MMVVVLRGKVEMTYQAHSCLKPWVEAFVRPNASSDRAATVPTGASVLREIQRQCLTSTCQLGDVAANQLVARTLRPPSLS